MAGIDHQENRLQACYLLFLISHCNMHSTVIARTQVSDRIWLGQHFTGMQLDISGKSLQLKWPAKAFTVLEKPVIKGTCLNLPDVGIILNKVSGWSWPQRKTFTGMQLSEWLSLMASSGQQTLGSLYSIWAVSQACSLSFPINHCNKNDLSELAQY